MYCLLYYRRFPLLCIKRDAPCQLQINWHFHFLNFPTASSLLHIREILVHWPFLEISGPQKWVVGATLAFKRNFLAETLIFGLFSTIIVKHPEIIAPEIIYDNNEFTKTTSGQQITLRKQVTSVRCTLEPMIQSCDTGQWIFFLLCQLTIIWMSISKLNKACLCLGHQGNNVRWLQGNLAQSAANQIEGV